jgi:hypothetical protein
VIHVITKIKDGCGTFTEYETNCEKNKHGFAQYISSNLEHCCLSCLIVSEQYEELDGNIKRREK